MPSTERRQRRIDAKLPSTSAPAGTPVTTSAGTAVSPEIPTPQSPTGLTVVGSFVVIAAITPEAVVNLRWVAINSPTPDSYAIQWSTSSGFSNPTTLITARDQVTAAVSSLPVNTQIWFRIAARWQQVQSAWSASVNTTTPQDSTAAAAPTSATATFGNLTGDLTVRWTNPTSANYRDVEIKIFESNGGAIRRTEYVRDSPYVYSLENNKLDSSSAGDPTLYLELRSRTFAGVFSASTVTLSPTFATPAQVTGVTATANAVTGSVRFAYSSVSTAIAYRLTLDTVARDTTATTYEYTKTLNESEHGGTFDASIAYSIVAVDAFGQVSATATTGTATFGVPSQPSGVTATFTQPDCRFSWPIASNATGYRLSIDGVDRDLGFTDTHTYTLARNALEHGGTASATLAWSLVAYNVAGASSPGTGSVTSPVQSAPSAVSVTAYFSTLAATTTHIPSAIHRTYQYRITRNSGAFLTTKQNSLIYTTSIDAGGSYQAFVLAEDVFGRQTSETSSSAVTADTLTIAELRAEGTYTDSQTVNNVLTDGTSTLLDDNTLSLLDGEDLNELKDNSTTSSGITYSAGTAWQNFTRFERPLTERYRTITAGLFAPTANTQMYVSTSVDGNLWRWFAGPLTSATSVSATLSEVLSETAARSAAVAIGSNTTVTRWDLPRIIEARYVRLHHRNSAGNAYVLYEFYPRRLVQSDDIEAESIKAINIAAKTITADQIAAGTISGDLISATAIDGKTITGATVQTSSGTGARVVLNSSGLTTFNSSNQVQIEVTTANSGELLAGQGTLRLNKDGLRIVVSSPPSPSNDIQWVTNVPSIPSSNNKVFAGVDAAWTIFSGALVPYIDIRCTKTVSADLPGVFLSVRNELGAVRGRVELFDSVVRSIVSGTTILEVTTSGIDLVAFGYKYHVNGTPVVGARITGWATPGGTLTRNTIAADVTAAPTAAQFNALAQNVRALITDMRTHGLIND